MLTSSSPRLSPPSAQTTLSSSSTLRHGSAINATLTTPILQLPLGRRRLLQNSLNSTGSGFSVGLSGYASLSDKTIATSATMMKQMANRLYSVTFYTFYPVLSGGLSNATAATGARAV